VQPRQAMDREQMREWFSRKRAEEAAKLAAETKAASLNLNQILAEVTAKAREIEMQYGLKPESCACEISPKPLGDVFAEALETFDVGGLGEAGYILPDGKVVWMEERHAELETIYSNYGPGVEVLGPPNPEPNFMAQGAVRVAVQTVDSPYYDGTRAGEYHGSEKPSSINIEIPYGSANPTKRQIERVKRIAAQARKEYKVEPEIFVDVRPIANGKVIVAKRISREQIEEAMTDPLWAVIDEATKAIRSLQGPHIQCGCVPAWAQK
jgi:hypothetical protein